MTNDLPEDPPEPEAGQPMRNASDCPEPAHFNLQSAGFVTRLDAIAEDVRETAPRSARGEIAEAVADLLAPNQDAADTCDTQAGVAMRKRETCAGTRDDAGDFDRRVKRILSREALEISKLSPDDAGAQRHVENLAATNDALPADPHTHGSVAFR